MDKIKVSMGAVPETMLQTMYARARETQKPNAVIHDDKAVEIIEKLDYDFSLADKDAPMSSGVIARTIIPNILKSIRTLLWSISPADWTLAATAMRENMHGGITSISPTPLTFANSFCRRTDRSYISLLSQQWTALGRTK